jgi:hypothetical protein
MESGIPNGIRRLQKDQSILFSLMKVPGKSSKLPILEFSEILTTWRMGESANGHVRLWIT